MVHLKRSYGDGCGIAQALDLIGDRWALLIVRDLLLGPKRFTDLQAGLPGAGATILGQRLRDLEYAGVVRRRTLPAPAASRVYELTQWGRRLDPILMSLGRWGLESPVVPHHGEVGADSMMLSLRDSFQPRAHWDGHFGFRLNREYFTLRVTDGALVEIMRGPERERPDTAIETDTATLGAVLGGEQSLQDAINSGRLDVEGDVDAVRRLLDSART